MSTAPATIKERVILPAPPSAGAAGAAEGTLTVTDVIAILKRRFVLITILFLLFCSMTVGGWLAAYRYFPTWPGEAFVECVSDKPKQGYTTFDPTPNEKEYERFIQTQAHFVKSPEVLMDALKTAEVRATQWYKDRPKDRLAIDFMKLITAAPQRGTNLLKVSVQTRSGDDPHVIVNQVVQVYINRVREYNTDEFRDERTVYQKEKETIKEQILDLQKQLGDVQKQLPPGVTSGAGNVAATDYQQSKAIVTELELRTLELHNLHEIYNQPGGPGLSPEDTQLVELDPQVATLSNQLFSLTQQLEVSRKNLGDNHRAIQQLHEFIDVVRKQLEQKRQERLAEILAYKREQVKTAWLNSQHALLLSQEKLADAMAYMADMDAVFSQYLSLDEDIVLLKQNHDLVANYINELNRIVRERAAIRVALRQQAVPPLQRSFPQKFLLAAGVAMSLVFAVGIGLILEFVDTSLRTPQDMVKHLRIPLLGIIPDADDEEVEIDQVETAVRDAPQSMLVEAVRAIRTNLQFTAPAEQQRSIVITSPKPEDGRTAVACNLAGMVAEGGRHVLLVDANFRRPAIHRFFPVRVTGGLSNILVGNGKFQDYVSKTDYPNMDVLISGPVPPNPAELMGSKQMGEFIDEVIGLYDQVIFDAPPVLLASDACLLAARTDGVIMVCRAKANSRGIANRACGLISRVDSHIFGGILNAAQVRRGGYFREQLRAFYDYRVDGDDPRDADLAALPDTKPSEPESTGEKGTSADAR